MEKQLPQKLKIHINGPFNTEFSISYSMTAENIFNEYRRKIFREFKLRKEYSLVIERFRKKPDEFDKWLEGEAPLSGKPLFEENKGKTKRDISIFTVDVDRSIQLHYDELNKIKEEFEDTPFLKELKLQYHENGIGVFSGFLEINLKDPLPIDETSFKNLVGALSWATIKSEELKATITEVDKELKKIIEKLNGYSKDDILVDVKELYEGQKIDEPLWRHAISILGDEYYFEDKLPYGDNTRDLLNVSHPMGLIDFNCFSKGFVHIGWGMSLVVGISPGRIDDLVETHNKLQYYWRSIQVFNDVIISVIEKFMHLKTFSLTKINESIDKIDRLKIEFELYLAHNMNYFENLDPFSYYIYKETCKSWRLDEMTEYCRNKLNSCSTLHKQGESKIRSHKTNQLNFLVSVLAIMTLFSWGADSTVLFFTDTNTIFWWQRIGRIAIACLTPVLVVVISIYFYKIAHDIKKLD